MHYLMNGIFLYSNNNKMIYLFIYLLGCITTQHMHFWLDILISNYSLVTFTGGFGSTRLRWTFVYECWNMPRLLFIFISCCAYLLILLYLYIYIYRYTYAMHEKIRFKSILLILMCIILFLYCMVVKCHSLSNKVLSRNWISTQSSLSKLIHCV